MLVKRIVIMMLSAMVMAVVMVVSITIWTANKNNLRAAEDSLRMVGAGFDGIREQVSTLNYDYAAWNAALNGAMARDVDWLSENMGSGATGAGFDLLEIFWPQDWSSLTWTSDIVEEGAEPSPTPVLPLEAAQRVQAVLAQIDLEMRDTQDFALEVDGTIRLFSVSKIQMWQERAPFPAQDLPILVMSQSLTPDVLGALAETFLVDDLTVSLPPP